MTDIRWVSNMMINFTFMVSTITITISLYLMMDHNKLEYIKFLRIIKSFMPRWICKSCRKVIDDQILDLDLDVDDTSSRLEVDGNRRMTNMVTETKDECLPIPTNRPRNLSEATFTGQETNALYT